ncbi:MAG: tyrosine-protein phosphatase [Candidatus Omnitrophica bacterium]|nr:tyrosine-protein phosphatase [Candidatus Omnitrophota bacterium]
MRLHGYFLIVLMGFFGHWGAGSLLAQPEGSSRWLGIEGAVNSRDAGGYITQNGGKIRWGVLLRSNQLAYLTERGQQQFQDLGVKTIVDFRTESQAAAAPDVDGASETASYHHFPIGIEGAVWEDIYLNIVTKFSPSLAQAFHMLADSNNLPMLVHCVAGKDRTGVFIALVHRLLGVHPDDIMRDYLLSLDVNYHVAPDWLKAVLDLVEKEGGIESFLANRGVDPATQQAIRDNLLVPYSSIREWEAYRGAPARHESINSSYKSSISPTNR